MNKQTLKKYYKGAKSSLINSYVKIDNEFYITNGISIMNLKEFNQNFIEMPTYSYSIKKYVESFKGGKFRALDLENYNQTCDLIHATNVSILDLEEAGHPVIYINNRKTGAFGWLLPCRVY